MCRKLPIDDVAANGAIYYFAIGTTCSWIVAWHLSTLSPRKPFAEHVIDRFTSGKLLQQCVVLAASGSKPTSQDENSARRPLQVKPAALPDLHFSAA